MLQSTMPITASAILPAPTATNDDGGAAADALRWQQVRTRDRAADGAFVFAVRSTGIYCRPGCPSRTPRRDNVRFFDDGTQAAAAGFRACLRCRPDDPAPGRRQAEAVAQACRLLESSDDRIDLATLAAKVGLSRWHLHRTFREVTGMTPGAYRRAKAAARLDRSIAASASITDAAYDAGFGSASRFYEQAGDLLGMSPGARRRGGLGETVQWALHACSLGLVMIAATERGVCAIEFGDDGEALQASLRRRFPNARLAPADARFDDWLRTLLDHLDAPHTQLALPLDVRGTAFQRRVWDALRAIPPGATASYAQIAERIGAPKAARAVARACASNAVAIAIPCHRVVRGDGEAGGYRWGEARKVQLLARERAAADDGQ